MFFVFERVFPADILMDFQVLPLFYILNTSKHSFENSCHSPDGRENPFVAGFAAKDWKEQQDQAPYYYSNYGFFKFQFKNSLQLRTAGQNYTYIIDVFKKQTRQVLEKHVGLYTYYILYY